MIHKQYERRNKLTNPSWIVDITFILATLPRSSSTIVVAVIMGIIHGTNIREGDPAGFLLDVNMDMGLHQATSCQEHGKRHCRGIVIVVVIAMNIVIIVKLAKLSSLSLQESHNQIIFAGRGRNNRSHSSSPTKERRIPHRPNRQ